MTIDAQLLADDGQARRDALEPHRSFIVQAPAGSGKTELLIQRYLRLLSFVDDPEEIIAITFTRKAAAEMQNRVLAALQDAHQGSAPAEEHRRVTYGHARAALAKDQEHGWNLIENPRRLRIQTIDSLNGFVARARPISAPGNATGVRLVTDAELDALRTAAAMATLDWLVESGPFSEATRQILEHVDNNTGRYVEYLAGMLETRDQWLPFIGAGLLSAEEGARARRRFEENLGIAIRAHLELLREAIPGVIVQELVSLAAYAAVNLADGGEPNHPSASLAHLDSLPEPAPANVVQWIGLAELLLKKDGTWRRRVDKRSGFPPGDSGEKARFTTLLEELGTDETLSMLLHEARDLPPETYSDEQWNVLLALFRLLPLAAGELERLFAEQGVSDHTDVAITASGALGSADSPGDVALLLDYQVRHILVDEMQDTSTSQYRMLEALTGGWEPDDGRTLFCVGDPMQSIYRFRNAEVGQFLLAKQHGIGTTRLEPLVLRRNFRSGAGLVDWFNSVFPSILAPHDDPASGAVSYSPAVAVPELTGDGRCIVHPLFSADVALEAAAGCRIAEETLRNHPGEDMAVLVRSRTQLPHLLADFRRAGISYRAIEIDRLTDLPEIIEVLALTRAAVHLGDRIAWLATLRAPWIGLDWQDLHALTLGDTQSSVWELLGRPDRLDRLSDIGRRSIENAMPVLAHLVEPRRSKTLRDLVETCWLRLGGAAVLGSVVETENVYRYLDVLEKHERHGSLDDVAMLEQLLDEERVSMSSSADLQIMTLHKAKGLEFDHVLLYGLGRVPRRDDQHVLSWFDIPDEHGIERKIIGPVSPRSEVGKDPVHRFIETAQRRKSRNEQSRLLYVGCTRARKTLHLLGHVNVSRNSGEYSAPAKDSLLRLLWPHVEAWYASAFEGRQASRDPETAGNLAEPRLHRFDRPWTDPGFSTPAPSDRFATTDIEEREVEFYWVGTGARLAGTLVHRWLQAIAEGQASLDDLEDAHVTSVSRRWLREAGIGDTHAGDILRRVRAALDGIKSDERGRWILEGPGLAEFGITGIYRSRLESVVLDRVRIDEAGQHWIIDYKTSSHEGGDLDGFLQAEARRYEQQLDKYASLYEAWSGTRTRCALYFPLLRAFIEVPRQARP